MPKVKDEVIDRLIQIALDVLHHDTDHGDAVDQYEREVLRAKFTAALNAPSRSKIKAHERKQQYY